MMAMFALAVGLVNTMENKQCPAHLWAVDNAGPDLLYCRICMESAVLADFTYRHEERDAFDKRYNNWLNSFTGDCTCELCEEVRRQVHRVNKTGMSADER
jgi:hypothetical protein